MSQNPQFSLRSLLVTISLVGLLLFCVERMIGPAMPRSLLRQIKVGMTKDEVSQILGMPQDDQSHEWQYSQFGNVGWVEIWFDVQGRVREINDESAFP